MQPNRSKSETNYSTGESAVVMGEALSGVIHYLSNLLHSLLLRADMLEANANLTPAERENLEEISLGSQKVAETLQVFLSTGRDIIKVGGEGVSLREIIETKVKDKRVGLSLEDQLVHGDKRLLSDLIEILFSSLFTGAGSETRVAVKLALADREDISSLTAPWQDETNWVELKVSRLGQGTHLPLEEDALEELDGSAPLAMEAMRLRGIIRLHQGTFKVEELVGKGASRLTVRIFLPAPLK
ncbi:MAG: hypothetical protein C0608_01375 [Deltaproteobacteria bacterium]|nr:MAG: hypothetical protein C0608_01375 [Deltaproteobacteria bacterium]